MNIPHSSAQGMKLKALAVALGLCLAGTAHSPRVEASGIPTFDLSNLTQMLMDWGTDAVKSCFNVNSIKEAVTRVQDIQRFAQRARVMNNMTELMPERDELEGIESCPNPSGGGIAGAANSSCAHRTSSCKTGNGTPSASCCWSWKGRRRIIRRSSVSGTLWLI